MNIIALILGILQVAPEIMQEIMAIIAAASAKPVPPTAAALHALGLKQSGK